MNTVVFALSRCPVGALGPYGNEWVATPNLDRLAAESVVYDRHYSDAPERSAAHRAWQGGGLLAHLAAAGVHTVLIDGTRPDIDPVPDEFTNGFAERFAASPDPADAAPTAALLRMLPAVRASLAGRQRWLVWVALDRLTPPWDVPQDVFDAYIEDVFEVIPDDPAARESTLDADAVLTAGEGEGLIDPTLEETIEEIEPDDDVEDVLPKPAGPVVRPLVAPAAGWFDRDDQAAWELLHRSFAAAVTTLDAGLGKLFAALEAFGPAHWLLTADRGQALGEHGLVGDHRPWLHEELVHVPLIVRHAERVRAGWRVAALTAPADVPATLCELLGAPPFPTGESVWSGAGREFVATELELAGRREFALRTAAWAYLEPGEHDDADEPGEPRRGPMLFVKPDDRFEMNDVRQEHFEVAEALARQLRGLTGRGGDES